MVDDLDGSIADETVSFGLDGRPYEIDLSAEHAEQLRAALGEWVEHARRAARQPGASRRSGGGGGGGGGSRREATAVRKWAQERGYRVSGRGRIPVEVLEAYRAAHS